jgi:tetratricopeptide (TPR) repeat protein
MLDAMRTGDCIDGRFEIQERIGAGGMGVVYRALDRQSGATVAVKLLWDPAPEAVAQFDREARALASLGHPHVVQYVTHGVSSAGEPYLAMEWLAGESLFERLARGRLDIAESIDLARRVAGALGAAHARGIVHRDIKPSNLFLAGGLLASVKLLDFGIARLADGARTIMRTGLAVGTAGYMAPEQARGQRDRIDARTDVFSLGCVLFECLTGRPAFQGEHANMLLAKVLFDEPPRVSILNDRIPAALDELVARMLAKEPADRPADGLAVATALGSVALFARDARPRERSTMVVLSLAERHLISIVAADVPLTSAAQAVEATPPAPDDAIDDAPDGATDDTIDDAANATRALHLTMQRAARRFDARVEILAGGGVVAMLAGAGNATDRATLAARCALEIASAVPGKPIALVTGWGESRAALPVGEVLDRAALLLEGAGAGAQQARPIAVRIDDVTRGLLDARFEVVEEDGLQLLCGEQAAAETARLLLGKPSPFVGRERELRHLVELAEDSLVEQRPVAILVTAPAGMGKSRLGREFVRAVKSRHLPGGDELAVGMGRGDSVGAGSTFAMLAAALRSALGIPSGEPVEVQRDALVQAVGRYVGEDGRQRVSEFLGELLGTPFSDDGSPQLQAARRHPPGMAAQIENACLALLRGLTAARPVLLVFEDLHWGDAPSVRLVDVALRELEGSPLAVLALARPEVHERFPGLWSERQFQEMRLSGLSRKAAAALVQSALGDAIATDRIGMLVDRAGGNAFYLEELVRASAGDRGDDSLPETVLGVVAERLDSLEPEVRRLLRAGSVFGQRFCTGGAMALLGHGEETREVWQDVLADLVQREVLTRVSRAEQRFAGEDEHAFRHALIREAAYAMMTERDRVIGHQRAGEWLLRAGEQDSLVLAEHFAHGGQGTRAAAFYVRAAEQAVLAHDIFSASAHAERGLELEPEKETRAGLYLALAGARFLAADFAGGYQYTCRALDLATPGSRAHGRGLQTKAHIAMVTRQYEVLAGVADELLAAELTGADERTLADAFSGLCFALVASGLVDRGEACLRRLESIAGSLDGDEPFVTARLEGARAQWKRFVEREHWAALRHARTAVRAHERIGEFSFAHLQIIFMTIDLVQLGATAEARDILEHLSGSDVKAGGANLLAAYCEAVLHLQAGHPDEGIQIASRVEAAATDPGLVVVRKKAQYLIIQGLIQRGDLGEAEHSVLALGLHDGPPHERVHGIAALARIRLLQGRHEEALCLAGEALQADRDAGMGEYGTWASCRLVHAEALHAAGELAAARQAIREARDDLLARADTIEDPAYRHGFLNVTVNARILALAGDRLGEADRSS